MNLGQLFIIGSALVAVFSLFLSWSKWQIAKNGFESQAYLFLIIFIYPIVMVVRNKIPKKKYGYLLALLGALFGITYMLMNTIPIEGVAVKAYGYGPYIFMISCLILGYGIKDIND